MADISIDLDKLDKDKKPDESRTEDAKPTILIDGVAKPLDDLSDDDLSYLLDNAETDDKGNKILPDEVVAKYYRVLPDGTRNISRTRRVYKGGMVSDFTGAKDNSVQISGGKALQAKIRQRLTFRETLLNLLAAKATPEQIAALGLGDNATKQDAISAAMILQAADGNRGAAEFVRDTVGEKPADVSDVSLHTITDADRSLLDKVQKRLDAQEPQKESGGEKETK